ncbi:hypothetical protein Areg01_44170 [Actinoplanes regularis]|nr:hypothetical protein Areg01_44170 [Actinoplanes regularis]
MSATPEAPLTWRNDVQDGLPVLTMSGTLTAASGQTLPDVVVELLSGDQAAMLIDVSAMAVTGEDALAVFGLIMDRALRWPDVLVLICASPAGMTRTLEAHIDPRLMVGSVAAGREVASRTAPTVTEDMLPLSGAPRRARDVVTEACLRWTVPELVGPASLVASELVTNAAVHAHTMMTMQIRLRPCHLRIAVFDGSPAQAVAGRPTPGSGGGRGLWLVEAVSAVWGSTALPSGKVVWSALKRPAGD